MTLEGPRGEWIRVGEFSGRTQVQVTASRRPQPDSAGGRFETEEIDVQIHSGADAEMNAVLALDGRQDRAIVGLEYEAVTIPLDGVDEVSAVGVVVERVREEVP